MCRSFISSGLSSTVDKITVTPKERGYFKKYYLMLHISSIKLLNRLLHTGSNIHLQYTNLLPLCQHLRNFPGRRKRKGKSLFDLPPAMISPFLEMLSDFWNPPLPWPILLQTPVSHLYCFWVSSCWTDYTKAKTNIIATPFHHLLPFCLWKVASSLPCSSYQPIWYVPEVQLKCCSDYLQKLWHFFRPLLGTEMNVSYHPPATSSPSVMCDSNIIYCE